MSDDRISALWPIGILVLLVLEAILEAMSWP